jgi:hypothetical protein
VALTDCNEQNHRFTKPGRICGRLFFYSVCDHVNCLAPFVNCGHRRACRAAENCRVAWNSTSDNASLPLIQVGNAATDKQNGEGSRLRLYKTAQSKIFLLTVRTQNADGTFITCGGSSMYLRQPTTFKLLSRLGPSASRHTFRHQPHSHLGYSAGLMTSNYSEARI